VYVCNHREKIASAFTGRAVGTYAIGSGYVSAFKGRKADSSARAEVSAGEGRKVDNSAVAGTSASA
jgi:hypothetical protein